MASPRAVYGLRLYYLLGFVALGIFAPSFPRWLEANGIRGLELGLVAAASPLMGLVSPPLFGWLADRTGARRQVVAAVTLLSGASVATLALLSSRGAPGVAATLACAAVFAFFRAPTVSLADLVALEADVPYGPTRLWGSVGFLVAAILAGRYLDPTRPELLVAIAVAYGVAALATGLLPARGSVVRSGEEPGDERTRPGAGLASLVRADPALGWLLACALCLESAHSAYDLCYSLHLRDAGLSPATAGVLWAFGVAAEVGFFLVGERVLLRLGPGRLLVLGCVAIAVRLLGLGTAHELRTLVPLQALHALTFGATWTSLMTIVKTRARPASLGALRGVLSATVAVGGAAGMVAWGAAYPALGSAATFRTAASLGALATGLALACARRLAPLTGGATASSSAR